MFVSLGELGIMVKTRPFARLTSPNFPQEELSHLRQAGGRREVRARLLAPPPRRLPGEAGVLVQPETPVRLHLEGIAALCEGDVEAEQYIHALGSSRQWQSAPLATGFSLLTLKH